MAVPLEARIWISIKQLRLDPRVAPFPAMVPVEAGKPLSGFLPERNTVGLAAADATVEIAPVIGFEINIAGQQPVRDRGGVVPDPESSGNGEIRTALFDVVLGSELVGKNDELGVAVEDFPPKHPLGIPLRIRDIWRPAEVLPVIPDQHGVA